MSDQSISSSEFMLNEYNMMKEFRELIIHQVDNRVNLYLKMISTAITVIPAFSFWVVNSNDEVDYEMLCVISGVIAVLLLCFGILSFFRVIEGHISIINYTRAINRARRYFYDRDRSIRNYISMPVTDNTPSFGTYGFSAVKTMNVGATSLVMLLNVFNLWLLEGMVIWYLGTKVQFNNIELIFVISGAAILGIVYYILLRCIYNKRMRRARQKAVAHFTNSVISDILEEN